MLRQLGELNRLRRKLVSERRCLCNRVRKTRGCDGVSLGGILSDLFEHNGRLFLNGLVASRERARILAEFTSHMRPELTQLAEALTGRLGLAVPRHQLAACD